MCRQLVALSWCGSSISGLEWINGARLQGVKAAQRAKRFAGGAEAPVASSEKASATADDLAAKRKVRWETPHFHPIVQRPCVVSCGRASAMQSTVWLIMHCLISGACAYPNATAHADFASCPIGRRGRHALGQQLERWGPPLNTLATEGLLGTEPATIETHGDTRQRLRANKTHRHGHGPCKVDLVTAAACALRHWSADGVPMMHNEAHGLASGSCKSRG